MGWVGGSAVAYFYSETAGQAATCRLAFASCLLPVTPGQPAEFYSRKDSMDDSMGDCARNAVRYAEGGIPTKRLNTLLNCGMDPNPAAKTTSEIRSEGSASRALAFTTRTRATYSVRVIPVAFLKILQK